MKLLRLKITDPAGFRSLRCGFEHYFRTEWGLQDELAQPAGFAPFVCAGPNGSGKSNLLEALAAIFFQLEILRVRRSFLPEVLQDDSSQNSPTGFELEYLIKVPAVYAQIGSSPWFKVEIHKRPDVKEITWWVFDSENQPYDALNTTVIDYLIPQVLGYSSGENQILSLPFFKVRFVQFDEYWNALTRQLTYNGHPETRLAYLDSGFSQAILLCNLLFQDEATLQPFREEVGIDALREFRIIIRRSILLAPEQLSAFASEDQNQRQSLDDIVGSNPALRKEDDDSGAARYRLNLMQLLEADESLRKASKADRDRSLTKYENFDPALTKLKRCATLSFVDEATDTLILDFRVNDATKKAFHENFEGSPLALFQALQVLLTLNLYTVSDALKTDLYRSSSRYATETVPTLASHERVMRFKNFYFTKQGVQQPMLLKELSDGEHQLLHSLGLCLLFRETNSLFLLDEPETHFNPGWRASFISRLRQCLPDSGKVGQEMLITTHSPFLISDSKPDKVLIFKKDETSGAVSISNPDYNTLGASINKITMNTFGKRETIGGIAEALLERFKARFEAGQEDLSELVREIEHELGDSVEKILLIKAMLDKLESQQKAG